MKMIIGGAFQGKKEYALERWPDRQAVSGKTAEVPELLSAGLILDFQDFVRNEVRKGTDLSAFAKALIEHDPEVVIVTDETGYGIVPIDPEERLFRETHGRICTVLAAYSDLVIRIVSGIPQVIKDLSKDLAILLIRHGKTTGNLESRYVGCRTNESLCEEGIRQLSAFKEEKREFLHGFSETPAVCPERIFASPMKRCLQTSEILYPGRKMVVVPDLKECDFGRFENRNYLEMTGDPEYQAWIESGGTLPFPGGESRERFRERCRNGFVKVVDECILEGVHSAAVIVHEGTIRNILCTFTKTDKDFYDWKIDNGGAVLIRILPSEWRITKACFVEGIE